MFSYKAKNYALLTKEGEVIIKGGALKSRGLEKFQRVFLEEMIKLIMEGQAGSHCRSSGTIRTKNPQPRMEYRHVDEDRHAPGFAGQISGENRRLGPQSRRRLRARSGQRPQLQAGRSDQLLRQSDSKKVPAYEAAKLASDFDPQNRDENVDYYVAKLDDLVKKFAGLTATASSPKQESLAF